MEGIRGFLVEVVLFLSPTGQDTDILSAYYVFAESFIWIHPSPTETQIDLQLRIESTHLIFLTDWRQSEHSKRKLKKTYRRAQQLKRSTSKDPKKKSQREQAIQQAYLSYLHLALSLEKKVLTNRSHPN
jgi:hypothetical protein